MMSKSDEKITKVILPLKHLILYVRYFQKSRFNSNRFSHDTILGHNKVCKRPLIIAVLLQRFFVTITKTTFGRIAKTWINAHKDSDNKFSFLFPNPFFSYCVRIVSVFLSSCLILKIITTYYSNVLNRFLCLSTSISITIQIIIIYWCGANQNGSVPFHIVQTAVVNHDKSYLILCIIWFFLYYAINRRFFVSFLMLRNFFLNLFNNLDFDLKIAHLLYQTDSSPRAASASNANLYV